MRNYIYTYALMVMVATSQLVVLPIQAQLPAPDLPATRSASDQQVSVITALEKLLEIGRLPLYEESSGVRQVSSFDREGGNNDGFEGRWSYLRKNADGSLVIFEAEGGGVIERIWTPTPTDDTLDFYFDGAQQPSWSVKFRDLFTGKQYPFLGPLSGQSVGGFYTYLPIPYAKGCRIVFRGKKLLFYQVQYREYAQEVRIETFRPQFGYQEKRLLERVNVLWGKAAVNHSDHYGGGSKVVEKEQVLKPGKSVVLARLTGGGRVTGIEIGPAHLFENSRNDIDLRIRWDDEKQPAVQVPVADFFGYAFGSRSMQSLLAGVKANTAYCYIPMPFDREATVELVYRGGKGAKPVNIQSRVYHDPEPRDPGREGRFYAHWKKERPPLGAPYVFLEGKGKGHYIGTLLQGQATTYEHFTEFFEGDDSTVIDGVKALQGTGSEDYFNGGWYAQPGGWVERKSAPLHGCLDYSLPFSRTGGYRFYLSDKLPFRQQFYHSIEHGPERNNREVEYRSVALYYAAGPIAESPVPGNTGSAVFVPDTLSFYTRLMDHVKYGGHLKLVDGNAELAKGRSGQVSIDVSELFPGQYELYLHRVDGRDELLAAVEIRDPRKPVVHLFQEVSERLVANRFSLVRRRPE